MRRTAILLTLFLAGCGIQVNVIDGDTMDTWNVVEGKAYVRVRLFGIDAPEKEQMCKTADLAYYGCGHEAKNKLIRIIMNAGRLLCQKQHEDRYGRTVAICYAFDPKTDKALDMAEELVRAGWAVDWPHYSKGKYAEAQRDAQTNKRGIWQGEFQLPADYRHHRDQPKEAQPEEGKEAPPKQNTW